MESRASPNSTSTWCALLPPALPPLAHRPALSPPASLARSILRETPYNASFCPFSNQRIDFHSRTRRPSPFEAAVLPAPSPRPFGFQIRTCCCPASRQLPFFRITICGWQHTRSPSSTFPPPPCTAAMGLAATTRSPASHGRLALSLSIEPGLIPAPKLTDTQHVNL